MIETYYKQAWQVMKQNPFFSFISILSTAVTIAFVMVAYMVYDLNSSNLPPEVNRTHSLYSDESSAWRAESHTNRNSGMSFKTTTAITENLPSAEFVSIHSVPSMYSCQSPDGGGSRARRRGRFVDSEWWLINQYTFISGRPITREDYEAQLNVVVVTEKTAREIFYSSDIVGREIWINFIPYTICGVVDNVSSQFSIAFADFWANLSANSQLIEQGSGVENVNGWIDFIACAYPGKINQLSREIEDNVKTYNDNLLEAAFVVKTKTHTEYTFNKIMDINPVIMYVLLVCILLIVPGVNISGLISSMLNKRYGEIGIRKAYGESRSGIAVQFLTENLLLIIIGGIIGMLLSFLMLYVFRTWLLGVSAAYVSQIEFSWWTFFRPSVFLAVFVFCLLFNLISTFIPVWHVSGRNINDTLKS